MSNIYKTIFGQFNGEHMLGDDNKIYMIPANYASKSRLIEGDRLKVTIFDDGSMIYKQVEPVERIRFIGHVTPWDEGLAVRSLSGQIYRILAANISYFGLKEGDEVAAETSKDSKWAAVISKIGETQD